MKLSLISLFSVGAIIGQQFAPVSAFVPGTKTRPFNSVASITRTPHSTAESSSQQTVASPRTLNARRIDDLEPSLEPQPTSIGHHEYELTPLNSIWRLLDRWTSIFRILYATVTATSARPLSSVTATTTIPPSAVESSDSQPTANLIADVEPDVAPIDHDLELAANRIRSLVYRWMSIFDENRGDAAPLIDLMSPEGFALHLTSTPEPITTIAALQSWFGELVTKVKTVNHRVKTIDVTRLEDGAFAVEIFLKCPGVTTSGVPFNLSSVHNWEVVDYGGQYPKIRRFATKVVNPDGSPLSFDQDKP